MLRSDLRALRNLVRTADGRKALVGHAIVLACLMLTSLGLLARFLLRPEVLDAVRADRTGAALAGVYGVVLLLPAGLLGALGMASLTQELYRSSHVPVLLCSPVSSLQVAWRGFVRAWCGWSLFALAFAVPPAVGFAWRAEVPLASALGVAVSAPLLVAPIVAGLLLANVVRTRWLSGPRLRFVVLSVQLAVALGVAVALLLGFVRGPAIAAWLGARLAGASAAPATPDLLLGPSVLPLTLAGHAPPPSAWLVLPAGLLLAAVCLVLAAGAYRRSYEVHLLSGARRALRARSRAWPTDPVRSLLAKAAAESWRVRGNLAFFAVLCALQLGWLATSSLSLPARDPVPRLVREAFFVLQPWQGLGVLMAAILFLAVVGGEQKQIALLATAPVARRDVLRAKRILLGWPFAATLAVAALGAPAVSQVGALGVIGFAALAVPLMLATLGCLLAIGSWPSMIRVHDEAPLANNLRSVVPSVLAGSVGLGGMLACAGLRRGIVRGYRGEGGWLGLEGDALAAACLAAVWVAGLALFALGDRVARGNFERLLGPQAE